jgi:hypothetical protein
MSRSACRSPRPRSHHLPTAPLVSRAFPSWNRSIVTEIYRCHACSCQELLRMETPRDASTLGGALHALRRSDSQSSGGGGGDAAAGAAAQCLGGQATAAAPVGGGAGAGAGAAACRRWQRPGRRRPTPRRQWAAAALSVRRAFPSWNRSTLTEIYRCHACSCHEILRMETAGQAGGRGPHAPGSADAGRHAGGGWGGTAWL